MLQKDYILKMIQMIAEVIARIIGLIKKQDPEQANILLENAYQDFLKQDAAFFRGLSSSELTNQLLSEHNYSHGHLQILAELFYAEAELNKSLEKFESAVIYYQKSLLLFRFVNQESMDFSLSIVQKIDLLENKLATLKN